MSQFWLKVKESYIIENFNELAQYLANYHSPANPQQVDEDFEATYTCLRKVAHEQCEKAYIQTNLYEKHRPDDSLDLLTLTHLTLASILTSHYIKRKDDYTLLIHLANLVLLNKRNLSNENCKELLKFVQMCIEHRRITLFTLNWRNIDSSIDVISEHLMHTTWADADANASTIFYEQNGLALIKNGTISLLSQNFKDFKLKKSQLPTVMNTSFGFDIKSKTVGKLKATATSLDVIEKATDLRREMSQITPTARKVKSDYAEGSIMPVVVCEKYGLNTKVRTLNPSFNELKGNLIVDSFALANWVLIFRNDLLYRLKKGDVLYAKYSLDGFHIDYDVYKDFYGDQCNLLCDADDTDFKAVFIGEYTQGTRWLDENGMLINIYHGNLTADVRDSLKFAAEEHHPILVQYKDVVDGSVVNGSFVNCLDDEIADRSLFSKTAQQCLIDDFLTYFQDQVNNNTAKSDEYEMISEPLGLIVAARALYRLSRVQDTTIDRVKTLATAIILTQLCGTDAANDKEFMKHELKFLECGIKFVRGDNPSELELTHVDRLDGVPKVMQNEHLVKLLSGYKQDDGLSDTNNIAAGVSATDDIDVENIGKLIEASNILRGKIQDKSLARIKAEIATKLELDDEYIPESADNESTYYGVESDTLEFKSSIVFPPCNRQTGRGIADPDNQRWVIIKTVCGFLNSHSGGELYLGVRDNGYACGLKDDIDTLYALDHIKMKSIDSYRNYVKCLIDQAFVSGNKKYRDTDVTLDCIKYDIMTNSDGLEILRVRVDPFPYDVVLIDSSKRNKPEWVSDAYIRTSGSTIPLSDVKRAQISAKRLYKS
jgi:hypothetical protein